jgi:pimeloyl-ACP methyl ester carboxylesterase
VTASCGGARDRSPRVGAVDIIVEGSGAESVVMVHGWPDTHRLWDAQVEALKATCRCVRFTLPGFDVAGPGRAHSLDELVDTLRRVVEEACPGERMTLLLHDWGCVFGYHFASRHPELVRRVIGVDVGDAGSRRHVAGLSFKAKMMFVAYQWWLALAWRLGGPLGDRMARWMARLARAPAPQRDIGATMGYPYAMYWFGVAGGFGALRPFDPQVPMLFLYGERKPFMFHSTTWREKLAARPGNRVIGLPTGHWVKVQQPKALNDAVLAWLADTDGARS